MKVVVDENTKEYYFTLSLTVAHASGVAGSPGGLQLIMVGTAEAVPYAPALQAFFQRYNVDSTDSDCDDSQLNIESVYERAMPRICCSGY